jgi:hypothetical protein
LFDSPILFVLGAFVRDVEERRVIPYRDCFSGWANLAQLTKLPRCAKNGWGDWDYRVVSKLKRSNSKVLIGEKVNV